MTLNTTIYDALYKYPYLGKKFMRSLNIPEADRDVFLISTSEYY